MRWGVRFETVMPGELAERVYTADGRRTCASDLQYSFPAPPTISPFSVLPPPMASLSLATMALQLSVTKRYCALEFLLTYIDPSVAIWCAAIGHQRYTSGHVTVRGTLTKARVERILGSTAKRDGTARCLLAGGM